MKKIYRIIAVIGFCTLVSCGGVTSTDLYSDSKVVSARELGTHKGKTRYAYELKSASALYNHTITTSEVFHIGDTIKVVKN